MSKTVKHRVDPANLPPLTAKQRAELAALAAMPDSEIDTSDIPPLTSDFWDSAVAGRFYKPVKASTTVRIDSDVLAWLKAQGKGYQTRINAILRHAMLRAMHNKPTVGQATAGMSEMLTVSRKIAEIISAVDGIAFQTSFVALNAAVEAAREGERGRGLAVVAEEVRSLAQRSTEAAHEIADLIADSVEVVGASSRSAGGSEDSRSEIVEQVRRVAVLIEEIAASIQQQEVKFGRTKQVPQQNSALLEQTAAAVANLTKQADRLNEVAATFRLA